MHTGATGASQPLASSLARNTVRSTACRHSLAPALAAFKFRRRGSISEPETILEGILRELICVSSASKGHMRLRNQILRNQSLVEVVERAAIQHFRRLRRSRLQDSGAGGTPLAMT